MSLFLLQPDKKTMEAFLHLTCSALDKRVEVPTHIRYYKGFAIRDMINRLAWKQNLRRLEFIQDNYALNEQVLSEIRRTHGDSSHMSTYQEWLYNDEEVFHVRYLTSQFGKGALEKLGPNLWKDIKPETFGPVYLEFLRLFFGEVYCYRNFEHSAGPVSHQPKKYGRFFTKRKEFIEEEELLVTWATSTDSNWRYLLSYRSRMYPESQNPDDVPWEFDTGLTHLSMYLKYQRAILLTRNNWDPLKGIV